MSDTSVLQSLLNEYHNGNIEYTKNKLKVYGISFSDLFNYYLDVNDELIFKEDIKLFVKRLT